MTEPKPRQPPQTDDEGVVVVEIEEVIDLHTFTPRDIPDVVESYLEAAVDRGFDEVRIIHGRGKGVQRARVQAVLEQSPLVESFRNAPAARGGWGATLARLARRKGGL